MEREEQILLSLKKLDYMTRGQLQVLHDLKSDRNAQKVLQRMSPYLNTFKDGQNIYYLNSKGRSRVECDKVRKKTGNINHYLMRNALYVAYGSPETWENEMRIKLGKITVVPDAIFQLDNRYFIVEVDNTQTMKKNRTKIDKYRRLIERNAFRNVPKIIWMTTTEYRRNKLLELCEGLDADVYLNTDFI